jgi:anti-sigma28 factor (negative regulator of flagellin synthesis)
MMINRTAVQYKNPYHTGAERMERFIRRARMTDSGHDRVEISDAARIRQAVSDIPEQIINAVTEMKGNERELGRLLRDAENAFKAGRVSRIREIRDEIAGGSYNFDDEGAMYGAGLKIIGD